MGGGRAESVRQATERRCPNRRQERYDSAGCTHACSARAWCYCGLQERVNDVAPARALLSRATRSHMHGHRLCLALRLKKTERVRGHALAEWSGPLHGWLSRQRSHQVQGSGITSRTVRGARDTGRPREAVGIGADGSLGAVVTRVVGELARTWTKESRKRGPIRTTPISAMLRPTSEEGTWNP
jgi:hypothetical protein